MPAAAAATAPAALAALEPRPVFSFFEALAAIPRPSKHEQKVAAWLAAFAKERSLQFRQDKAGNTVIYKPGQAGGEDAPTVILQGHTDMVCEKNTSSPHDFERDPISLVLDGGWLRADGTTLGADNGVGVAAILAVLDLPPSVPCPPLEALFTVEEEIGLIGASALDASMLTGRTLLNLDSEDWGVIYVGCAGAGESALSLAVERAPLGADEAADAVLMTLSIGGLAGGHSGLQIDQGLGNAVQLLVGALTELLAAAPGARLVDLRGGDKRNAIPREASADVLVPRAQAAAAEARVAAQLAALRGVYGSVEPGLVLGLAPAEGAAAGAGGAPPLTRASARRLLSLVAALPHGPVRMSPALAGLVETSHNVASIKPRRAGGAGPPASYDIIVTTRSAQPAALAAERRRIAGLAALAGAEVVQPPDYAGWAPDMGSPLLAMCKDAIAQVVGKEPKVTAIHAGLECGVLGSVLGGSVDMVSYGPTILGAHSPTERLKVSTVEPFWRATLILLAELAKRR